VLGFAQSFRLYHGSNHTPAKTLLRVLISVREAVAKSLYANGQIPKTDARRDFSDAWGNPIIFHYFVKDSLAMVEVRSAGPDGIYGTSDDITSAEKVDVDLKQINP